MKISTLDQRKPGVDLAQLEDYEALYKGGAAMKARQTRFQPQRPYEPDEHYRFRIASAHYLNYIGPIVNFFASSLFTDRLEIRSEPTEITPYYSAWRSDVDGAGTDLVEKLKKALTLALQHGHSWLLVDFPSSPEAAPETRAEWEAAGLADGYLCALEASEILDWRIDDRGQLSWAIQYRSEACRMTPYDTRDTVTETWTVWASEGWERYSITYPKGKRPGSETELSPVANGRLSGVPLVLIELPPVLWILDLLAEPQIEHMRNRNALSWSLGRTAYAQRIVKVRDREGDLPKSGAGYGIILAIDESIAWDAPPAEAFTPLADYTQDLKDEIYRVSSQMALGVENNSAAVGRSAASKKEDSSSTAVILKAYGKIICEATKKALSLLSSGRGDVIEWTVSGLSKFASGDVSALVEQALGAQTLEIPSPTFKRHLAGRVALSLSPDADQATRDAMLKEIEAGVSAEPTELPEVEEEPSPPSAPASIPPGPGEED